MAERQCARPGWGRDPDVVCGPPTYLYCQSVIDYQRQASCPSLTARYLALSAGPGHRGCLAYSARWMPMV